MRVIVIDSGQKFGQGGGWFDTEKNINGFKGMSAEVVCLGRNAPESITVDALKCLIASFIPDFIFSYMAQVNYGFYRQITESGISVPIVLWNGTDDQDFPFTSQISNKVALYCCNSNRFVDRHRSLGVNAIFLPNAADGEVFFKDQVYSEYQSDLCYVGTPFGNKTELLLPLEDRYECCFKFGTILPQREVAKVYNSAKIAVIPATHQDIPAPGKAGCSHSTFEVCATGAFLLQRDRPDLHLLYREDEIATFDGTFADLRTKIDYYLQHDEERETIAERAYQRTISEHLIQHRLNKVIECLGLIQKSDMNSKKTEILK